MSTFQSLISFLSSLSKRSKDSCHPGRALHCSGSLEPSLALATQCHPASDLLACRVRSQAGEGVQGGPSRCGKRLCGGFHASTPLHRRRIASAWEPACLPVQLSRTSWGSLPDVPWPVNSAFPRGGSLPPPQSPEGRDQQPSLHSWCPAALAYRDLCQDLQTFPWLVVKPGLWAAGSVQRGTAQVGGRICREKTK